MKTTKLFAVFTLLASFNAMAEIAVIVHPSNKTALKEEDIRRLFLLKDKYFPNGNSVKIYNLAGDTATKIDFYKNVLNKDEGRLNSMWVRALFSSKATPPADVDSASLMKAAVAANPDAIGFINANDVDDSVRVVLKK